MGIGLPTRLPNTSANAKCSAVPLVKIRGCSSDCEAYIEIEAANLMRYKACDLFDAGAPCGAEANMAKYLAAKAGWEAANACIQFGGWICLRV